MVDARGKGISRGVPTPGCTPRALPSQPQPSPSRMHTATTAATSSQVPSAPSHNYIHTTAGPPNIHAHLPPHTHIPPAGPEAEQGEVGRGARPRAQGRGGRQPHAHLVRTHPHPTPPALLCKQRRCSSPVPCQCAAFGREQWWWPQGCQAVLAHGQHTFTARHPPSAQTHPAFFRPPPQPDPRPHAHSLSTPPPPPALTPPHLCHAWQVCRQAEHGGGAALHLPPGQRGP